ncbi:MAG: class I mannose-6-phosphate isomerase [Bacteroidales bacterium]|nr:class I mannose-6-phosphate isomerase [Bacteroidales bacterium]MBN2750484.1 class I mannose-6-phosphate isomerase [Bacteroidales bacterium]
MSELYPLKFKPQLKERIWGGNQLSTLLNKPTENTEKAYGESWEISGVENSISVVSNGFLAGNNLEELIEIYMGDLVGDKVFDRFGLEFPLLIKLIDAKEALSIQVHPNDELAMERHQTSGKTELWYVINSGSDAEIITGFSKATTKNEYLDYLNSGRIKELLNVEKASKGDVFFIPSGRVHAIGAGILLAEIQQTSDITYRIYDWDRTDANGNTRELHTELAVDAIDFKHYSDYKVASPDEINKTHELTTCKYFTTNKLSFSKTFARDYNFIDSFVVYLCTEGAFKIVYGSGISTSVFQGETVLLPADLKNVMLKPEPFSTILETYIK